MPGTGHSARYKGSISNRVKKSPFQRLADWNAQLLGADGAVPTITGGSSLAFKKLNASDIDGVLHNPTKVKLQFTNSAGIQSLGVGAFKISADGLLTLSGALGTMVGVSGGEVSVYGVVPVLQFTDSNLAASVVNSGSGSAIFLDTTFGSGAGEQYTVGHIVKALIDFGILKK
jgi:hypothetical protein